MKVGNILFANHSCADIYFGDKIPFYGRENTKIKKY